MINRTVVLAAGLLLSAPAMAAEPPMTSISVPNDWTVVPWTPLAPGMAESLYKPLSTDQTGRPDVSCLINATIDPQTKFVKPTDLDRITESALGDTFRRTTVSRDATTRTTTSTTMDHVEGVVVSGHSAVLATGIQATTSDDDRVVVRIGRVMHVGFAAPGWHYLASCIAAGPTLDEADHEWGQWGSVFRGIVLSYKVAQQ